MWGLEYSPDNTKNLDFSELIANINELSELIGGFGKVLGFSVERLSGTGRVLAVSPDETVQKI